MYCQVVGDNAPVALPPQTFRTHDRCAMPGGYRAQLLERGCEFTCVGVVGERAEGAMLPG